MEESKPPPRALPPLGSKSSQSFTRGLPNPSQNANSKDSRALPSLSNSQNRALSNSELLDDTTFVDERSDTVRNRSIARKKRRARNAASTRQSSALEQPSVDTEVSDMQETPKKIEKKSATTRAMRREARKNYYDDADMPANDHIILANMINDEDVVPVDRLDSHVVMTALPGVAGSGASSQPQDKVYIQTTTGFKSHSNEWLVQRQMMAAKKSEDLDAALQVAKTSHVALAFQRVFMFIGFLLHGLVAGIAIWQIVYPFSLNAGGEANFVQQYFIVAQPIQTAFYVMLVYCLISAFDRFNLGGPGKNIFWRLLKFDPAAWLIAVYFLGFACSVGLGGIDFWLGRIALPLQSDILVSDAYFNADPAGAVRTWLILNIIRCTCCIFGWLIVSVKPRQDDTSESLFEEET